jgi:hypothetical protein
MIMFLACSSHKLQVGSGEKKKPRRISRVLAVGTGLEPATPCVTGTYSNQLNYPTSRKANANIQPLMK